MTSPGGEFTGPGLRGLRPRPGDQVLLDHRTVAWLRGEHWMRVTIINDPYAEVLELAGWLLPRDDLGEVGISDPLTVRVADPAQLVVRRAVDAPPIEVGPPATAAVPGPVEQVLAPAVGERTHLPAAVLDALERPDHHQRGETGVWRWPR